MDITYLLKVLWRKKWLIIILPVVSCIAAYLFTMNMETKYRAVSQISTGFTTNEGVNITDERFNLRTVDLKFSNLLSMMNSGILYNLVSYRLVLHDLDPLKEPFHSISDKSERIFAESELQRARKLFEKKLEEVKPIRITEEHSDLLRDVLKAYGYTYPFIRDYMYIKRVPNTDFIQVDFISDDPRLSAFAVNAYCEEFLHYYRESKKQVSGESVDFFAKLVTQKKQELDEKSEALRNFKSENSFLDIDRQGESKYTKIANLETQRDEINSKVYGLQLRLENLKNSMAEVMGERASASSSTANQRVTSLRQKIDQLNEKYIASGSTNTQLLDSLNLLRQQYKYELNLVRSTANREEPVMSKGELDAAIRDAQVELRVEQSKLGKVNANLGQLRGGLSGDASKEATLNALEREVKVASDEYLDAVQKHNEAQKKLMASTGSIKQTYEASPPATPESSKRLLIIALAGFTTFGLCVFVIIIMEVFDTSIKTPNQFQRVVGMPLAGSLIKINTNKLNFNNLFARKHKDQDLELFKHFLRKIRFEIESTEAKAFMVTSPKVGEGKTFVIFALSFVLSLLKKKILIIDTNFKNNTLTRWLSIPQKPMKLIEKHREQSLKLYQAGGKVQKEEDAEKTTGNLVSPTKYNNIFLIGNGGGYDSPEEIFHNRDFGNLMELLKTQFDYIFIEGASLNEYSDTKEMIKYVDKVIPVFSAESSIKPLDRESVNYLSTLDGKLTGAVLNKVDSANLNV